MPVTYPTHKERLVRPDDVRDDAEWLAELRQANADAHGLIEMQRGMVEGLQVQIATLCDKLSGAQAVILAREALINKLCTDVLAWLGYWSDWLPAGAVADLRSIININQEVPDGRQEPN